MGWTVRGSNRGGGEIFRTCPDRPWGQPSLLYNGYWLLPGVKCCRGMALNPHPLLVPWSRNNRAIPLFPLWAVRPVRSLSACTGVYFTFTLCLHNNILFHYIIISINIIKRPKRYFKGCRDALSCRHFIIKFILVPCKIMPNFNTFPL